MIQTTFRRKYVVPPFAFFLLDHRWRTYKAGSQSSCDHAAKSAAVQQEAAAAIVAGRLPSRDSAADEIQNGGAGNIEVGVVDSTTLGQALMWIQNIHVSQVDVM
jgi:hypothetical protein